MRKSLQVSVLIVAVLFLSSAAKLMADRATTMPATTQPDPGTILTTKHYVVTITDDRAEGDVTSDSVIYEGVSKRTGRKIRLVGSTWHTHAEDGTPGRFIGYIFKNGKVTYSVDVNEAELQVTRGDVVLADEVGTWNK